MPNIISACSAKTCPKASSANKAGGRRAPFPSRSAQYRLGIDEPNLFECASFDEVFDCVDRGKCEFGVVAKENSLEGSVTATLDNFSFKSSATILGEEVIDIHHCLVMHPDAKIEDVATVASHAQGLAQCRRFLSERLPGRSTIT